MPGKPPNCKSIKARQLSKMSKAINVSKINVPI